MIINKLLPFFAASVLMLFSGCIQEEPLNAECDILGVDSVWINEHKDILIGTPIVTNSTVSFYVQKGSDRTNLNPYFELTPGAKIAMKQNGSFVEANGVSRDFSSPQIYTTMSEDGNWNKDYTVTFNYPSPIKSCSFEHFELDKTQRYHTWFEFAEEDTNPDENTPRFDNWATGNAGFALTGMGKQPADYPTVSIEEGYRGKGVKLETRSTGSFGEGVNMPIAAGNIFVGEFRASQAMIFPRKATRFGLQLVAGKPLYLSGYYKYTAGPVFTDKLGQVDETRKDTCDIYAVLYEVDPGKFKPLNGDEVLNSERIVSIARIDNPGEPKEWTEFVEPFRPMNGKTFDLQRYKEDGYAIAIVATSSRQGAYFEGAIGSVLYVDEIKVTWEEYKK